MSRSPEPLPRPPFSLETGPRGPDDRDTERLHVALPEEAGERRATRDLSEMVCHSWVQYAERQTPEVTATQFRPHRRRAAQTAPRWVTLVREMGHSTRRGIEGAGPGYEHWPVEFLPAVNGATENTTPALFVASGKVAGFELWTEPTGGERICWCGLTGGETDIPEDLVTQCQISSIGYHWENKRGLIQL